MIGGGYVYHRYIPKPNGTYERQVVEDRREPVQPVIQAAAVQPAEPAEPCCETCPKRETRQKEGSFLRRLLPKGMGSDDLLILAILLLLLVDCNEDDMLTVLVTIGAFLLL